MHADHCTSVWALALILLLPGPASAVTFHAGASAFEAKDYPTAIARFEEALDGDPGPPFFRISRNDGSVR